MSYLEAFVDGERSTRHLFKSHSSKKVVHIMDFYAKIVAVKFLEEELYISHFGN